MFRAAAAGHRLFLASFQGRYELLSKAYQVILRKSAPDSNR